MDLAWLEFAWKVVITIVNVIGWGWMYMTNRNRVTNERITNLEVAVDTRLDTHGNRIVALESQMKSIPTHGDLARIHGRIDDVAGSIKRIEGENSAQTRILNLVYESLIGRKS